MTVKANRLNKDTRGQEHLSVAGKIRLSRQPDSMSLDRESESQNGVKPKDLTSPNSLDVPPRENKNGESNSHIRRESLKQNSHIAITRAEQSQHQADRSFAFIR